MKVARFCFRLAIAGLTIPLGTSSAVAKPAVSPVRYVYYLHGKIVEDLGPRGVSPQFGAYDYPGILKAFENAGLRVQSEVRPKNTDVSAYANKIVADIGQKLKSGVPASHITVVGASKGAVIAMLVSDRMREPRLRYVFLADCNDWFQRTYNPHFNGEVLSVFERSDDIGKSCAPIARRSPGLRRFKEFALNTGLGHGLVYRPLKVWVEPAIRWAKR
jgi:hypothetical protein